jgi:hypothetical protein
MVTEAISSVKGIFFSEYILNAHAGAGSLWPIPFFSSKL